MHALSPGRWPGLTETAFQAEERSPANPPAGDEVAGFRVVHLPGHAPGLIGLFRESDRLALVSDTVYTLDSGSGRRQPAHVPHPAFNQDTAQALVSIRKLAGLDPTTVWPGHADPVTGDVAAQLDRAASGPA